MGNNTYGSKNLKIKKFNKLSQEELYELFKKYQIQQSEMKCVADYVLELKQKIQACKVALESAQDRLIALEVDRITIAGSPHCLKLIKKALDMIEE